MDWKQRDFLLIYKLPYGGYVVSDGTLNSKFENLFSGSLDECFAFIEKSITFDERMACGQPAEVR